MDAMEGWSDFYTLAGATAGTLIGLIFVVVGRGADNSKTGPASCCSQPRCTTAGNDAHHRQSPEPSERKKAA